jgi:hypothetical protein
MRRQPLFIAAVLLLGVATALTRPAGPKFYPDDPVWTQADTQDASQVKSRTVDLTYDMLENSVYRPGDRVENVRAQNVNTIDEVPDSSWFINRADRRPLTVDEIMRGPDTGSGPAPGVWLITSAKIDGIMPGFTMRDTAGTTWFVKFDPKGHLGMATGTEVLTTKLLWAVGYHVPENHIARVRRNQLVVAETASIRTPSGRRRMKAGDLDSVVRQAATESDGAYRVVASRRIEGTPLGPFRFHGTRRDDPNDYIPHEHRRELRGYATVAAWLNHVDPKSINTFDALVQEPGRAYVRHYLLDFGSTIGSAGVGPREPFEGSEYLIDGREVLAGAFSFGFPIKSWRTRPVYRSPAIGAIPADDSDWDPDAWKPRYPNPSFMRARADDKFWAASKLLALTPDLIEAAVRTAQYTDPAAAREVERFLVQRKRAILRRYLTGINPVRQLRLGDDEKLTFENAAVEADVARMPSGYRAAWYHFDNETGAVSPFGESRGPGTGIGAPVRLRDRAGEFLKVELASLDGEASWTVPVHAYFRRGADRWTLVGFERMPGGNRPTAPSWAPVTSAPAVTPAASSTR